LVPTSNSSLSDDSNDAGNTQHNLLISLTLTSNINVKTFGSD